MSILIDVGAIQASAIDIGAIQNAAGASSVDRSVSDSITLSDSTAKVLSLLQSFLDGLQLTDVQTIFGPDDNSPFIFTDDFLTLSDSISIALASLGFLTQSVSDSFAITDSVAGAFAGLFISVSDALTILDNWNYLFATAADSFALTDQVMGLLITILIQEADQIQISDGFQVLDLASSDGSTIEGPPLGDSFTLSDSISNNIGIPIVKADTISISDFIALAGAELISVSDLISFTDFVQAANPQGISVADFITLQDFIGLIKTSPISPSDTVSITDQVQLIAEQVGPGSGDSFSISDQVELVLSISLEISDALSLTDNDLNDNVNSATILKAFSDALDLEDFVVLANGSIIQVGQLSDFFSLNDAISVGLVTDLNPYLRRYLNDVVT